MRPTFALTLALALAACAAPPANPFARERLDPPGLHSNPAFAHAVLVRGPHRALHVGGQDAVDAHGNVVGKGDVAAQAAQVAKNLQAVLAAAGAGPDDVVQWRVYLVHGQPLLPAMRAFQQVFGRQAEPAALSVLQVAGLAHPDFLLEVEALAVLPE